MHNSTLINPIGTPQTTPISQDDSRVLLGTRWTVASDCGEDVVGDMAETTSLASRESPRTVDWEPSVAAL